MKNIRDNYDFVGWIPCISGDLLFGCTECGLAMKGEIYANANSEELDPSTQQRHLHIVVSSGVDWDDEKTGLEGKFRVVFLASAPTEVDHLEGQIYIIPFYNGEWEMHGIGEQLSEIDKLFLADQDIKTKFVSLKNKLNGIPTNKIFTINYKLTKSAFIFLRHNNKDKLSTPKTSQILARQAYYYIKYAFHRHTHHDRSAESLTSTYRLPWENSDIGMMLSNGLKGSLVTLKRDLVASKYRHLTQASGVVCYAKSLLESCKKAGFMSADDYQAEKAYFTNLGESLDIVAKKIEKKITDKQNYASNFRAVILFAVSIVAPITIIFREEIRENSGSKPTQIINYISYFTQSYVHLVGLVGTVFGIYWLFRYATLKYGSLALALAISIEGLEKIIERLVFSRRSAKVLIRTMLILGSLMIAVSLIGDKATSQAIQFLFRPFQ